jgi:uncharacterized protein (DUF2249 family)
VVIRASDRVSAVLRENSALVEVFATLSPALERLRSPATRSVMARLTTVEQAAWMGGVEADELVRRLNAAEPGENQPMETTTHTTPMPPALAAIADGRIIEADVRADLRSGKEPFGRIMSALKSRPAGGALLVRAIFEPVPLYTVMGKQGLAHHTVKVADDDWKVWFYEEQSPAATGVASAGGPAETASPPVGPDDQDAGVVVLDVRGLEPPEPMVRTLAALEALPPGGTLLQINVRVPQFLLPMLEERGFAYEVREQAPDLVRVFIRRAAAAGEAL